MSLNKVELIGHIGADPEMRYLPDGTATAMVNVATTSRWKDRKTNESKEKTEWHRVVFFGKLAEVVGEYLKKGAHIYVEGRLQTRSWDDKQGIKRYTTEIMAGTLEMLDKKPAAVDNQPVSDAPPGDADNAGYDDIPY